MLTFRSADMGDVHTVFSDLSEISADEVLKECGSWWAALPKVAKLLTLDDAQTEALVDEAGHALAIFGHYPSNNADIRTTWFVFSKGFEARGIAATLACKRRVGSLRAWYPGTNFHSYTASGHWERSRWFSILDFQYVGTTRDGQHHYILLPTDKTSDVGLVEQYNPTNPRAS